MARNAKWGRVEAAIAGKEVDRIPFSFWMHFPRVDRDPDKLVETTLDLHRRYDMDFMKLMFRSSFAVEDWGVKSEKYHPYIGNWLRSYYPVQKPEDWHKLKVLNPREGVLGEQLGVLKNVAKKLDGEAPILATVFSPSMLATNLAGQGTFLKHLAENPSDVSAGLDVIRETVTNFGLACLEEGADGVFFAIKSASFRVMSAEQYKLLGDSFDRPALTAIHNRSNFTMLHAHGDDLMFEDLAGLPIHVINWYDHSTGPTVENARNLTGKCLAGGFDHERTLMIGIPDEIKAEVEEAVNQADGRGFMLAPGCTVPITVPLENLQALKEASLKPVS